MAGQVGRELDPLANVETGEIVDRRSLVIRSATPVPEPVPEERTEQTRRPDRRPNVIGIVCLVLAGLAAGGGAVTMAVASRGVAKDIRPQVEAAAGMIAGDLDAQARAIGLRAGAIASASMLRAAIVTDAATMADLARSEVNFPLEPGDTLEIVQDKGGARASLLRLPDGAGPIESPGEGKLEIGAGAAGLEVVASASVPGQGGISGEALLRAPIDLGPIRERAGRVGSQVVLVIAGTAIPLADGQHAGAALAVPVTPTTATAGAIELATFGLPPTGTDPRIRTIRLACFGGAGVLVLVALATMVARRSALAA